MNPLAKLTDTFNQIFQISGATPEQAQQLATGYLDQTVKRSALRLVEKYPTPGSDQIVTSVQNNLPVEELIGSLSANFTDEQLAFGFAQGFTEIFGPWFISTSPDLSEEQKNKIQVLLKDYQK